MNKDLIGHHKNHRFLHEIFLFYTLFIIAVYVGYFKSAFSAAYFSLLLFWCWFSKKNYFWIAFFFLILQEPAYFFLSYKHLPRLQIFPDLTITAVDLFTLLMLIKVNCCNPRTNLRLKMPLILLMCYFIFAFFNGIVFYKSSLAAVFSFVRPVFYYSWIILFAGMVKNKEETLKFFRLFYPIIFVIFFAQLYSLIKGDELINLFDPTAREALVINTLTGEIRPVPRGMLLVLLSYISSIVFFQSPQRIISKVYLCLVFGISALIAFLSATRVWFGIFLFITAGVFLKKIKYLSKMLVPVLLILVILFSLMKSAILTKDYLTHSTWGRVSQIFDLGSGKCENIDTLASRLDDVPTLLNAIRSNPFFGYGFSDISYKCYDSDIGFLNTIMMFGIIGFCFFVYLYISYFKMMFSALNKPNSSKEFPLVLLTTFCAMLIAYFLTWDFFSLYHAAKVSFLMVFFGLSEISAKEN